jgi:hypothetical protein
MKILALKANMDRNGGVVRSDLSGIKLRRPQKNMDGITPHPDEWQFDHKDPNGPTTFENLVILSRAENRRKSNN